MLQERSSAIFRARLNNVIARILTSHTVTQRRLIRPRESLSSQAVLPHPQKPCVGTVLYRLVSEGSSLTPGGTALHHCELPLSHTTTAADLTVSSYAVLLKFLLVIYLSVVIQARVKPTAQQLPGWHVDQIHAQ